MDITKTRAELVSRAMDELQLVGSGQSAEDEDKEKVDDRVDGLFGELASRGVCVIGNEDAIPVEWTGPLAELLANEAAPAFGVPKKSYAEVAMIEDRLKTIIQRNQPSRRFLETDKVLRGSGVYTYNDWLRGL